MATGETPEEQDTSTTEPLPETAFKPIKARGYDQQTGAFN